MVSPAYFLRQEQTIWAVFWGVSKIYFWDISKALTPSQLNTHLLQSDILINGGHNNTSLAAFNDSAGALTWTIVEYVFSTIAFNKVNYSNV